VPASSALVLLMPLGVAACTGMLGWLAAEKIQHGRFTALGAASGLVAGLVAITPACASVSPPGVLLIGLMPGFVYAYAIGLKNRFGFDDSLDAVGVHLVGGILGAPDVAGGFTDGATARPLYGGGIDQLLAQAEGADIVFAYSFTVSPDPGLPGAQEHRPAGERGGRERLAGPKRARRERVRLGLLSSALLYAATVTKPDASDIELIPALAAAQETAEH
jgi:hypothetical protein